MSLEEQFLAELESAFGPLKSWFESRRGPSIPANYAPRYCGRDEHRGWAFWADDGRPTCGICHPPAHPNDGVRFLVRGGPTGPLVDLATTPSGKRSAAEAFTPYDEPQNDEKPRPRRYRRGEAIEGQTEIS